MGRRERFCMRQFPTRSESIVVARPDFQQEYGDKTRYYRTPIVTDADALEGTSEVDESMLTSESLHIFKTVAHYIESGTVNGGGGLTPHVSRLPGRTTITDIANLAEQAQVSVQAPGTRLSKVAGYFVPIVAEQLSVSS